MAITTLKISFDDNKGFHKAIYFHHDRDFYGQFCDDLTESLEIYDPKYLNDAKTVYELFTHTIQGDIGFDDYAPSCSETPIENPDCVVEITNGAFHFQMGNRTINRPLSDWPLLFPR